MAVKEVCRAGYVTVQCRCMQELHGSVTVVECTHDTHDRMVKANARVLEAAGLTVTLEWEPRPSFHFPEHRSQSSGFDGRMQSWRCSCGWEVCVPITSEHSAAQHQAAINTTFGAFQAHKIASNGAP